MIRRRAPAALGYLIWLLGLGCEIVEARQLAPIAKLKVFLDCTADCFPDFLRSEVTFVDYVRDAAEAELHVLVTGAETGSGGREYTLAFIGRDRLVGTDQSLKTVTTSSDPEDVIRRQLATSLRIGLLRYVADGEVPARLDVTVNLGRAPAGQVAGIDRWNNWVFSLEGSATFEGEESTLQRSMGLEVGADRITPDWKVTLGLEVDHEHEEFDLDEEVPVAVDRRERDFQWLVVNGLGEHWSIGAQGEIESTTFDNKELAVAAGPAIEYNLFPYSMYTRRQLRAMYAVGVERVRYYEVTLFGKIAETLPRHETSLAFEQRERWGSLEARLEWSQYLHDLSKTHLQAEGQFSVRVAKGLSFGMQLDASRIRDQLFIPARGATEEEILLRQRRLLSGYEYSVGMNVTYTFGSIFSSVVNPRFGQ